MKRRDVLTRTLAIGGSFLASSLRPALAQAQPVYGESNVPATQYLLSPGSAGTITQAQLMDKLAFAAASGGGHVVISSPVTIACVTVAGSDPSVPAIQTNHALVIPENVVLDLGQSTLSLQLDKSSYGVRLSRNSAIQNGKVQLASSTTDSYSPFSTMQAIFQSCISVGAALSHGGTGAAPAYHSHVSNWRIENMTCIHPGRGVVHDGGGAIVGVMSNSSFGVIRNVVMQGSADVNVVSGCSIGLAFDWGTVDASDLPLSSGGSIPAIRARFDQGQLYTTHPNNIQVSSITIGMMGQGIQDCVADRLPAAVRLSACNDISFDGINVPYQSNTALLFTAGDLGYEFALDAAVAHRNLYAQNLRAYKCAFQGVYVDGLADNVYDAQVGSGYVPRLPTRCAMGVTVRFSTLRGPTTAQVKFRDAGVRVKTASGVMFEGLDIQDFTYGVHVSTGAQATTLWNSSIKQNRRHGIFLDSSAQGPLLYTSIYNCDISGNTLQHNGTQFNGTPDGHWAAIAVGAHVDTVHVNTNTIGSPTGEYQYYGVLRDSTATNVIVANGAVAYVATDANVSAAARINAVGSVPQLVDGAC